MACGQTIGNATCIDGGECEPCSKLTVINKILSVNKNKSKMLSVIMENLFNCIRCETDTVLDTEEIEEICDHLMALETENVQLNAIIDHSWPSADEVMRHHGWRPFP